MKKVISIALVVCALVTISVALLFTPKIELGRNFCKRTLWEQVNHHGVSIVRVRLNAILSKTDSLGLCVYELRTLQALQELSGARLDTFKFAEPSYASCRAVGSEFIVILTKAALKHELKTCGHSAIVNLSEQQEILRIMSKK